MKISYVIPVYNNANTLAELARSLSDLSTRMHWDHEIIFVDDNSQDNSIEILRAIGLPVIVLHLKKNYGQSTSVLTGMKYVTGDLCVVMDADLQDRPDFIPTLINNHTPDTDIVFSGRMGNYEHRSKLFSAKGFKFILHLLSNKRLPVNACMFFAIKKSAIPRVTVAEESISPPQSHFI